MIKDAWTLASILAFTNLGLGWYLGYRSFTAYLAFWLLSGFVAVTSVRLARRGFGATNLPDTIIRSATLAFALVVLGGLLLGSAGGIGTIPYLVFFGACFAASTFLRRDDWRLPPPRVPIVIAAVLVPTLVFVIAVGIIQSPLTLYDSLSYHLFFPARWLQAHRLSIIATPFSDEAQAYAPGNGELFFLWLMAPFRGDLVARIGQLPFYVLGAVTVYALARRMGARPVHAAYAPAFYCLSKPIVEQAVGADVDLVCWSMFLASLYIGIAAVDSNRRRDWALWGIALGLYFGTKYVSLVYAPVLLLIPLMRRPRLTTLWALPGIFVLGAPWYVRNWIIAGSPLYPSSLKIAGFTIAQGAYSRAAMLNSVFHTADVRLLPPMLSHAFGTTLFVFWIPVVLIGTWTVMRASVRRGGEAAWWPSVFLLAIPVVMVALQWFGVPDNVDSRFLMPVAMLALLPLAFVFRTSRVWNGSMHALLAAGLLWLIVGYRAELQVAVPWFMRGWLTFDGIIARGYIWPFIAIAGITVALRLTRRLTPVRLGLATIALAAVGSTLLAMGSNAWCAPDRCQLLNISPIYIRTPMFTAWQWVAANLKQTTIAYTGNNIPYPLVGDHLDNRVYYVNIDRHLDWRFHDYDFAHRQHHDDFLPPSTLAVSSGVLDPLPYSGPPRWHVDAVRPRYERMEGDRDAWVQNLKSLGVQYLFVSTLSAYEINYVSHNDDGFPIEDDWARADPGAFTVAYDGPEVRIFAVHLR